MNNSVAVNGVNSNTMAGQPALECSRASLHTYIPMEHTLEMLFMQEPDYEQVDMYRDGMKIRLEFPSKTGVEEESIKRDVKNILMNALQEQLQMRM